MSTTTQVPTTIKLITIVRLRNGSIVALLVCVEYGVVLRNTMTMKANTRLIAISVSNKIRVRTVRNSNRAIMLLI